MAREAEGGESRDSLGRRMMQEGPSAPRWVLPLERVVQGYVSSEKSLGEGSDAVMQI